MEWNPGHKQVTCCGVNKYFPCLDDSVKSAKCDINETAKFQKVFKIFRTTYKLVNVNRL